MAVFIITWVDNICVPEEWHSLYELCFRVLLRLGENEQKKTHLTPEELDRYMRLEDNT